MNVIDLDCQKRYTFAAKIVAETGVAVKAKLTNNPDELRSFIGNGSKLVFEAGCNWDS